MLINFLGFHSGCLFKVGKYTNVGAYLNKYGKLMAAFQVKNIGSFV